MIHVFDDRITTWVQSAPLWTYQPMRMITNAGQPLTVILFSLGIMIWAVRQNRGALVLAAGIVLATVIVSSALKLVLRRARPETEYVQNMFYASFSFPSGHAAAATVGFGFLAYLAWASLSDMWGILLAGAAILFGVLVGVSRIYLGAHFPSDVIGGIVLGLAGLSVIIFFVHPLS